MIRNDYRRAFIMLRPALPGYGGHARLERRTATGSLYVVVTAPEDAGAPEAALTGRRNGEYYAAALGPLRRDRRGQWTLAVPFDPRNVAGRPLEAYRWLTIVRTADGARTTGGARTAGGCAVALNGNLEGSCELDAVALAQAVCALYAAPEAPAADIPSPGEPAPEPEAAADANIQETEPAPEPNIQEPAPVPEANIQETESAAEPIPREPAPDAGAPQAEPSPPEDAGDVKIYVRSKARVYTAMAAPERRDPPAAEPPAAEPEAAAPANPAAEPEAAAPANPATEPEAAAAAEPVPPQSAAEALGLDASSPWNGALEPLRRLFAENPPAEDAPQDSYTYVRAPMPAGSGFDACYIGLHATGGAADGLRYAIPGANAAEPPAGMDGYAWSRGFWIIDAPVE